MNLIEKEGRLRLLRRKALQAVAAVSLAAAVWAVAYRDPVGPDCVHVLPVLDFVLVVAVVNLAVLGAVSLDVVALRPSSGHDSDRESGGDRREAPVGCWIHFVVICAFFVACPVAAIPWLVSSKPWEGVGCRPAALGLSGGTTMVGGLVAALAAGYVFALALVAYGRVARAGVPIASHGASLVEPPTGTVICCSGGGIRSAAFCLGGLQRMSGQDLRIYQGAKAVVAVSGGGYIASAFQAVRRQSRPGASGTAKVGDPDDSVFGVASPEMQRLRRETRYLISTPNRKIQLAFSLLLGIAINVSLSLAFLRPLAWLVGWGLHRLGVAPGTVLSSAVVWPAAASFPAGLVYLGVAAVTIAPAVFLLSRILENFAGFQGQWSQNVTSWLPARSPEASPTAAGSSARVKAVAQGAPRHAWAFWLVEPCDQIASWLLKGGAIWMVVWPGIPLASAGLARLSGFGWGPFGASKPLGSLALSNPTSFVQVLAPVVVAFVGVVGAAMKARGGAGAPAPRGRGRIRVIISLYVLPWLGAVLVLSSVYLMFARWTLDYAIQFTASGRPVLDVWLGTSLAAIAVLRLCTNANMTTLYPVYKKRLADAYLMNRTPDPQGHLQALNPRQIPTVYAAGRRESEPGTLFTPELVLCATANVSDQHLVPAGRRSTAFVFSGTRIGLADRNLPPGGLLPSDTYEQGNRSGNSLASAMAISGAALAPSAGRETVNVRPYRLLMTLANVRLGVWIKNPYWVRGGPDRPGNVVDDAVEDRALGADGDDGTAKAVKDQRLRRLIDWLGDTVTYPGPGMILHEGLGLASLYAPFLYVTDGGHLDNLGLVEALRRNPPPEKIYVLDASADLEDSFITLAEAIATARMDLGVQIAPFDLGRLTRGGRPAVTRAWTSGTATHPGGGTTEIVYIKALHMVGLSTDLDGYHAKHPSFPQTGTTNQVYDEFDLEAFRELGWQLVDRAVRPSGGSTSSTAGR